MANKVVPDVSYYWFILRPVLIICTFWLKKNLLLSFQEYCYDNMNFTKVFQKMVLLLYKSEWEWKKSIIMWFTQVISLLSFSLTLVQSWNTKNKLDINCYTYLTFYRVLQWSTLTKKKLLHFINAEQQNAVNIIKQRLFWAYLSGT